jgi:hypothetical protein
MFYSSRCFIIDSAPQCRERVCKVDFIKNAGAGVYLSARYLDGLSQWLVVSVSQGGHWRPRTGFWLLQSHAESPRLWGDSGQGQSLGGG